MQENIISTLLIVLLCIISIIIVYIIINELIIIISTFISNKFKRSVKSLLTEEDLSKSSLSFWDDKIYVNRNGYSTIFKKYSIIYPFIIEDEINEQKILVLRYSDVYKLINKRYKFLKNN